MNSTSKLDTLIHGTFPCFYRRAISLRFSMDEERLIAEFGKLRALQLERPPPFLYALYFSDF